MDTNEMENEIKNKIKNKIEDTNVLEDEDTRPQITFNWELFIGIVLLIPPILSVLMFLLGVFDLTNARWVELHRLSSEWTGGGDGFTASMPFYFGLMAIAGVYIIKGSFKKK